MRTKRLPVDSPYARRLEDCPSFHRTGSIKGMKKHFYGESALLVICGNYIYNVTRICPEVYYDHAE